MNKKMYAAMLAMTVALPVHARSAEPVATMDEVVVTATKTAEKVRDVPNAVVLKNAGDIEDSPARSLGALLAGEPGLDWRTRGDYGGATEEIHIRGMGGDATQVFLNGININSPSLGTADLSQLPLGSIDRVEVVKGPGSLLYGTGAMGGTVNILTKSPERDKADFKVKSGFGTEGAMELAAEQGMYVADGLGYYLTASRQESDGFRDNSNLRHNDASLKLVCDKNKLLSASLYGAWVDRDYGVPGVKPPDGTQEHFVNGTRMYNSEAASLVNEGSDRNFYSALELKSQPLSWLTLALHGDAVNMENYFYQRYNATGTGQETWVTNGVLGLEATAEMRLPEGVTLLAGSQYRNYDYTNKVGNLDAYGVAVAGSNTEAQHEVFTRGSYGEAQWQANQYLKLLTGLRYEEHSMFGHETLPRFGLVVTPQETTTIKLGHGKHFKAPTMNDLYWPENAYVRGNPDLKPETGWHSDLTLEQSFLKKKLTASASYFKWNIDDKIDWAENPAFPGPWGDKYTPSNINSYEATGWEFGLVAKPLDSVKLGLSYTRTNAEEEMATGFWRQAQYTPRNLFKGQADYFLPSGLTTSVVVRYVGDRPAYYLSATSTAPRYTLDSYMTTDLRISQRFKEHWLAAINCNNIFDAGYDTYMANFRDEALGSTTRQGYPGAGRSAFASLSYEF
ncbi:MAG: TonB-dependent receptor [Deltaproteobacteria bacterium]|nr:TonB-dependent receptor [Deltaproteobacteria bacterium]